jgi:hypothetical protein
MSSDVARNDPYNAWKLDVRDTPTFLAERDPTQRLRDWVDLFRQVVKAAEFLSKTPFVPREMTGKAADVAACIMKGHELGMDPLDALSNIYVINGRVGMYAEFMRRRIIQSGHTFRIVESTDNRCVVEGTRKDGGEPQRASFTNEQARRAGIDLGRYPADKLVARATSRLCRQVFPDVLSGTLIAEDLIDGLIPSDEPATPAQTQPTPERPALKRARKPRQPKATNTQAPTIAATDDTDDLLDDEQPLPRTEIKDATYLKENDVYVTPDGRRIPGAALQPATPQTPAAGPAPEDDTSTVSVQPPAAGHLDAKTENDIFAIADALADPPIDTQPERLITPAQLQLLAILLKEAGFTTRENRHTYVTTAINRPITTSKELSMDEARFLIDGLQAHQNEGDE